MDTESKIEIDRLTTAIREAAAGLRRYGDMLTAAGLHGEPFAGALAGACYADADRLDAVIGVRGGA